MPIEINTDFLKEKKKESLWRRKKIQLHSFMRRRGHDLYRTTSGSLIRLVLVACLGFGIGISLLSILGGLIIAFAVLFLGYFVYFAPKIFIYCLGFYVLIKVLNQMYVDKEFRWRIGISNIMAIICLVGMFYIPFTIYHILTTPTEELQEYGDYKECGKEFTDSLFKNSVVGEIPQEGWKEFQGQKFKIQICAKPVQEPTLGFTFGSGGNWHYKIRVAIFDDRGNLQSLGYFTSGAESLFQFQIMEDSIEYGDWDSPRTRTIKMPPSSLERIRARLPSIREDFMEKYFPFWMS